MAFKQINFAHLAKFNSDASSMLVNRYKDQIISDINAECARPKSCTFAPSCMRCERKSWFRLRGTKPDFISDPDLVLNHTAVVGTALHEYIQGNLEKAFGEDWVDVETFLQENPIPYKYSLKKNNHETLVEIPEIPIKFACDGILRINGKYYLLEIKSSEYNSWDELTTSKSHHLDQIKTYCTILNISARSFTSMNISTYSPVHDSIRQCQSANPNKMAFRTTKSPTITIHLINLFD